MEAEDNRAAFQALFDGVWHDRERSARTIESCFTEDYHFHVSPLTEPVSRSGFAEMVVRWQNAFPDGRMNILDLSGEGDKVWCYWESVGTHSGEYLGIPQTGRYVRYLGVDIWRFTESGQVAESWAVPDVFSLLRQLGAIP
ncbi:MAG: ester cyclase [bacterium]